MPAPAGFKRLLEVALPEIVQSGPPTTWINLKLSLARYGLAPEVLDEYRQDIWNMFQEFLDAANNKHSRSQSRPARDRTPPSSCSRSVSSDESYAVHYNRQSKAKLTQDRAQEREDGWVQPVEMSSRENPPKLGVILCFSSGKENLISAHVIKQYKKQNERHLAHHDKGDTVELVCGLDSQPSRMYHVKFRVEEDADFDILLGKHWQGDEPDETGGKKSRKPRIEREYHGEMNNLPVDNTT